MIDPTVSDTAPRKMDPYTIVANAIFAALRKDKTYAAFVKHGNEITMLGPTRDQVKDQVMASDLPEVRLVVTSSVPQNRGSSSQFSDDVRFEIHVSTGDQRLDHLHLPLKWGMLRALEKARSTWTQVNAGLKFEGKNFVTDARVTGITEGVSNYDLNRGIKGWAAIWALEVQMSFAITDLEDLA